MIKKYNVLLTGRCFPTPFCHPILSPTNNNNIYNKIVLGYKWYFGFVLLHRGIGRVRHLPVAGRSSIAPL
jgi:hypothetical protein